MVDVDGIRRRCKELAARLDERGRRLTAASEALSIGRGGVTAVASASGMARSTITRGIAELRAGGNEIGTRIRRPGGGRKPAVEHQPGLVPALEALIEGAILRVGCVVRRPAKRQAAAMALSFMTRVLSANPISRMNG